MIPVPSPPQDIISSVRLAPEGSVLLTTSWDSTLRIYDVRHKTSHALYSTMPWDNVLLDSVWDTTQDNRLAYVGGFGKNVYGVDVQNGRACQVGRPHEQAVKSLVYHKSTRTVLSGSLDKTIQQIDSRASQWEKSPVVKLPGKVISMDSNDADESSGNYLAVAMSGMCVQVYDMRQMREPMLYKKTPFVYPIRSLRCILHGLPGVGPGYAVSSLDGKVTFGYYRESDQDEEFTFKSHRIQMEGSKDKIMPINALTMRPDSTIFFTGGSDGRVMAWDYATHKRKAFENHMPGAVVALDVDRRTGQKLAVGVSDDSFRADPVGAGQTAAQSNLFIQYLSDLTF
ncbi:uncharacterized protein SAPINGB_P004813 [Magnusiomyces paraingens]|uniref:Anaphase-promoting complex subunit 4 WD40 domain-containing protein n=1 Tax=Magnusiomyces paraingens TaxID=2606893 RepID=A0A5E8BYI2_9ASCO|nr:uncharacterized protein SAPINGB_P004813 [Saprochaete ingens]VVT56102.1 unnamed protein product [Saprochaete ingens]